MANESFHNVFHLFSGRTFDDKWSRMANIFAFPGIVNIQCIKALLSDYEF